MDKRRRQYVPLAVTLPFSNSGVKLKERFGRDGLLVWMLYLIACKTNWVQGQFTYTSETDGWQRLGLVTDRPKFTLDEFFAATGRLHMTRKRASGDVVDVFCRGWNEWNTEFKRERQSEEKTRKRHGNTETLGATEVEVEVEYEKEGDVEAVSGSPAARGGQPRLTAVRPEWRKPSDEEVAHVKSLIPESLRSRSA